MTNKLALVQKDFPPEKVELIKRMVAPTATDDELALFLYQSQRTGLDPLARQIIFSKFNSNSGPKMSIITTIDGYRLVADRTGKYAGNDDPIFEGENTPTKATVTVYKLVGGIRCPFTATARWPEYYPGDNQKGFMWRKMPFLMLGKCAEALALRKAFPAELSGLYTDTEMEQAQAGYVEGEYTESAPQQEPTKPAQPKQDSRPVTPQSEQPKKANGNGHSNGGKIDTLEKLFLEINKKTSDFYETKAELYNVLGGWPNFKDSDSIEAALSIAIDHANEMKPKAA
jgi:phage recombination protein Bet